MQHSKTRTSRKLSIITRMLYVWTEIMQLTTTIVPWLTFNFASRFSAAQADNLLTCSDEGIVAMTKCHFFQVSSCWFHRQPVSSHKFCSFAVFQRQNLTVRRH